STAGGGHSRELRRRAGRLRRGSPPEQRRSGDILPPLAGTAAGSHTAFLAVPTAHGRPREPRQTGHPCRRPAPLSAVRVVGPDPLAAPRPTDSSPRQVD